MSPSHGGFILKKEGSQANSFCVRDPFYCPTSYILRGKHTNLKISWNCEVGLVIQSIRANSATIHGRDAYSGHGLNGPAERR